VDFVPALAHVAVASTAAAAAMARVIA